MERGSRDQLMMDFAIRVAERSTCSRKKVGCIITNLERTQIVSYGYNGGYRGGPNQCERRDMKAAGLCGCVHSELNALIKAPYLPGQLVMFVTMSPCFTCAKLILNAGISEVFFHEAYRRIEGYSLLDEHINIRSI